MKTKKRTVSTHNNKHGFVKWPPQEHRLTWTCSTTILCTSSNTQSEKTIGQSVAHLLSPNIHTLIQIYNTVILVNTRAISKSRYNPNYGKVRTLCLVKIKTHLKIVARGWQQKPGNVSEFLWGQLKKGFYAFFAVIW